MAELVNASELARRLGVTEGAVRKHVRNGLYKAGPKGLFDADACKKSWEMNRSPGSMMGELHQASQDTGLVNIPTTPLLRARTVSATLDAKRRQIELQQLEGKLIERDHARAACLAVVHEIKTRLDGLPSAAAPVVHAAPTVAEAEAMLRGMVRAVLVEIGKLGDVLE